MNFKQGIALFLLILCSSVSAEEDIYLIRAQSNENALIQGAAYTDSDQLEVSGFVVLEYDSRASFVGTWTRAGDIEAVDRYGNMYLFKVIRLLNDVQAINFAHKL